MLKHEAHIIARMSLIDEMTPAVGNMNKKLKGTAKQASAVKQQMRFMRGGMGQVGHQVQDIAVQLQMGQNAMLVFGQQGSQIASLFGPQGAIIGAFLAVGAAIGTSLLPSLFKASEAMKKAEDESKDLTEKLHELSGASRLLAISQLKEKIEDAKEQMAEASKEIRNLSRDVVFGGAVMKNYVRTEKEVGEATVVLETNIENLEKQLQDLEDIQDGNVDSFKKMKESLLQEAATIGKDDKAIAKYKISLMKIPPAQKIILTNLKLANIARQEEIDLAKESAKALTKETEALKKREEGLAKVIADMNKKKMADQVKEDEKATREFRDTYRPIFNEFGDGFVDAITGAEKFSDAIRDMAKNVIDSLLRIMMQKMIFDQLFNKFESYFGPKSGSGTGDGSASRTGTLGGPVQSGRSVLVGERGPEIFTPSSAGQITPNNEISGGGGVTIVQHINVTTGVQQTVRAEIVQLMPQIAQAAKGAVADARLRGGSFSKAMGTT